MDPIFAVGDIHGHLSELDRVLRLIDTDPEAGAPVVFLGDYIDRGPDSRGVLDRLIEGQRDGAPWITLAGNHDRFLRDFLDPDAPDDGRMRNWLSTNLGGVQTLASYGVTADRRMPLGALREEARTQVPDAHVEFLRTLRLMHVTGPQVFAHAGIRPGRSLDQQVERDLLWIREGFLEDRRDHGRLVVHGHTAVEGPAHFGNRLNLDGGTGFGRPLCAALILGRDAHLLTEAGRLRLGPL
ncbi:metallophosphoesterase family protein [Roseivivax isoporae]|uniref:Serine/threonine protein phosphatase n=1 Tax=Roseivivax isoporae LMG 25204 TaxID=1449351 RepID=X7FED7_9RHOB|nr:metallophosphoesterase family protein [Roseivivax isoporae]ETX30436.1 serine/threonine protein phosphatase [Roseivivax isoporae LMG 25204]